MSPSPSVPEALGTLIERALAADGQPPFSDQSLVELARSERELVEGEHGVAIVGGADREVEAELVVDPDARGRGLGAALAEQVLAAHPDVEFAWAHGDHPASRVLAARFGFLAVRTLLQLRAQVTADVSLRDALRAPQGTGTADDRPQMTAFDPGTDDAEWLALNARAFADHPEQGKLTQRDLDDRKAEAWFDADDFLILRDGGAGGDAMIGFCWLKVDGDIGEFYAVGIDPGRQGEGLGRVLMDAGLARLASRGTRTAALYVEADNTPALALYRRYGFEQHTIDVRYRRGALAD
ncbi:mycothiol synthase [Leifsonia bigeumensis]|uniref:Mycothiol acetyltransferase n=1 Tax=Leifsonella bigeumensis TaxID=433643 RepID=A0ABP7FCG5_9MICO